MKTKPDIIGDVRSFMKSRVILSATELDFFSKLDGNFASAEDLADLLVLDKKATTRLLDCLVTYDLLEKEKNRYRTTEKRVVSFIPKSGICSPHDKSYEYHLG